MKKFKIVVVFLVVLLVVLELFFSQKTEEKSSFEKPIVTVSTFALYDIVKHIAGESVEVVNILPFGVDPHSFEPTPKLMAKLEKSAIVFYSGAGLEPWIENMHFKTKAVDMSQFVSLRELNADEFEHHKHHDEQCAHNTVDPHYWLDFSNMKKLTVVITEELIRLLPDKKEYFLKNEAAYMSMLEKLDRNYKKYLHSCTIDTVIINHNSLGYLANKYHFHAESLSGLSPEADPTPKDIKRILEEIEKDGVSTIFFENFVNSKAIKTIAEDAHVSFDVIEPLANITADEAAAGMTYELLMYKNLEKLSKALMCN